MLWSFQVHIISQGVTSGIQPESESYSEYLCGNATSARALQSMKPMLHMMLIILPIVSAECSLGIMMTSLSHEITHIPLMLVNRSQANQLCLT